MGTNSSSPRRAAPQPYVPLIFLYFKYTLRSLQLACTHEAQEEASYIYLKICDQGFLSRWESLEQHFCGEDDGLCYSLGPTFLTKTHFPYLLQCSYSSSEEVRKAGPSTEEPGGPFCCVHSPSPLCWSRALLPEAKPLIHAVMKSRLLCKNYRF